MTSEHNETEMSQIISWCPAETGWNAWNHRKFEKKKTFTAGKNSHYSYITELHISDAETHLQTWIQMYTCGYIVGMWAFEPTVAGPADKPSST